MSNVVPFAFKGNAVRVIEVNGEPWFVAKDVANALGYVNPQDSVRRHCKKAQHVGGAGNTHPSDLDGQTKIIPEGDVYRLIVRSRLPEAEAFETLIMDEILPSIRKTGKYEAQPAKLPTTTELALMVIKSEEEKAALMIENQAQACAIVNLKPRAESYDNFLEADGLINLRMAMREVKAKTNLGIKYLREAKHFFSEGGNANTPKAHLSAQGYFVVKPSKPNREGKTYPQTLVTPRGVAWLDSILPDEFRIGGAV